MTFRCGGTLGDTFMNILRVYNTGVSKIVHFTKHGDQINNIRNLYSLLGDIEVIEGKGDRKLSFEGYLSDTDNYTAFPKFDLPDISNLKLPDTYNVIQVQAGVSLKKHPWRFLDENDLKTIPSNLPIVIVGTDDRKLELTRFTEVIDLRNNTTLFESFSVIRGADGFYAPQGLLGFVALSQKVNSTLWLKHNMEINGMSNRIGKIKEWNNYINYINLIK